MTGLWGLSSHKLRPDQPGTCRNPAASGLCAKYSLEDANEWPGVETTPPPIHHSTNREMEVQPRNDLPKVNRTTAEPALAPPAFLL